MARLTLFAVLLGALAGAVVASGGEERPAGFLTFCGERAAARIASAVTPAVIRR